MKLIQSIPLFSILFSLLLLSPLVSSLPTIDITGYKFFNTETETSIAWKGIDYYPRPNAGILNVNNLDFFTTEYAHIWERDIVHLKALNINAIRIYAVDPSKNHDAFMCALDAAGIYVIVGMAAQCKGCAIGESEAPKCYPEELKKRGQLIIKAFARYSNTLAFSAGNEVNHYAPQGSSEVNAPCQKKFLRDMRAYIAGCPKMRAIPVGVVVADSDRTANALYYNCNGDGDVYEHAEWYGINVYLHCDASVESSETAAGFKNLKNDFLAYGYSIPVMLTEFGCLSPSFPTVNGYEGQRAFKQAEWLYEAEFQKVFAGGFVFEYSTELVNSKSTAPYPFTKFGPQNYGVGYFSPETCDDVTKPCIFNRMPNFNNLKDAYALPVEGSIARSVYTPSRTGRTTCPSQFPKLSEFSWSSENIENLLCPNRVSWSCTGTNPDVPPDNDFPASKDDDPKKDDDAKDDGNTSSGGSSLVVTTALVLFVAVAL